MAKKNIGPRISDQARAWLAENFSSLSAGAELVLECNQVLYARTLQEMLGKFERGELCAMVDVMNAHMLTPFTSGQELPLSIADAVALDALDKKWEFDGRHLLAKLNSLTNYQRACLEWWANGFWYGGGADRPERDLDAYVGQLLEGRP